MPSRFQTSLLIGLTGAILAVISVYSTWLHFSGYTLNGLQLDDLLYERFSYRLFIRYLYSVPIFVFTGLILILSKPYEHLFTRSFNAFSLFFATLITLTPILRILCIQSFSMETLWDFQYGFWILVASSCLLFSSWIISLLEVNKSLSKFEILRAKIKVLLNEVKSEIDVPVFAKRCGVSEKLLIDAWNKFKDEDFEDFIISKGKIISRTWLREKIKEKIT